MTPTVILCRYIQRKSKLQPISEAALRRADTLVEYSVCHQLPRANESNDRSIIYHDQTMLRPA